MPIVGSLANASARSLGWGLAELKFAMELVRPSSIAFSGTSASIVGLGSVDFSAVTSLSLNGVFSAEYDNYMVVVRSLGSVSSTALLMRLRASGSDASGSDYVRQYIFASGTGVSGLRTSSRTAADIGGSSSSQRSGDAVYLYGPALAQPTALRNVNVYGANNATIFDSANTHSLSTSYDGFTIFPNDPGTTSGRVAVYGMRG